MTQPPASA
jgi:hypothetical protein